MNLSPLVPPAIHVGDPEEEVQVDVEGEDSELGRRRAEEPSSSDEQTEPEVRNSFLG